MNFSLKYGLRITDYGLLIILPLIFLTLLLPLAPVFAQPSALLPDCDPLPGAAKFNAANTTEDCAPKHLVQLVINIYNYMLYFAAFIALLFIIWGGFRMLWYSYWEESETELKDAKTTVTRAIVGLVIVIAAFLIVNTAVLFLTGKGINALLTEFGVL